MSRYSDELKESVLRRMLPPQNRSVAELARKTGITETTLYTWRKKARLSRRPQAELLRPSTTPWSTVGSNHTRDMPGRFFAPVVRKSVNPDDRARARDKAMSPARGPSAPAHHEATGA